MFTQEPSMASSTLKPCASATCSTGNLPPRRASSTKASSRPCSGCRTAVTCAPNVSNNLAEWKLVMMFKFDVFLNHHFSLLTVKKACCHQKDFKKTSPFRHRGTESRANAGGNKCDRPTFQKKCGKMRKMREKCGHFLPKRTPPNFSSGTW